MEQVIDTLAAALARRDEEGADETAETCVGELRRICSALRGFGLSHEAGRAEDVARREEELKSIVVAIGESIRALAGANRQIAARLGTQLEELDRIAELPPGAVFVSRLREALASVREAAQEMDDQLDTMAGELGKARGRVAALEKEVEEARQKSLYDSLTRIHSRRALDERLQTMVEGNGASAWSMLLLDIDHFKSINDRFGHIVGDALLFKLSRVIEEALGHRASEAFFGRYGGEEFIIVLEGTALAIAGSLAESIREVVAASRWQCRGVAADPVLTATISIGVAEHREGDTVAAIIGRADEALYRAKNGGRNRVCTERV
jgi:diguanylate cyclase